MQRVPFIVFLGFLVWAVPFITGMLTVPLQQSDRPLFESIMPIVITLITVGCSFQFFNKEKSVSFMNGLVIGFTWFVISVCLDSLFFIVGPFRIPFLVYVKDIAATYLMIPVITAGFSGFSRHAK